MLTKQIRPLVASAMLITPCSVFAHDTWVQTNTALARTGDAVHVDFMLGNHGNDHRDYKLASKIGLDGVGLTIIGPNGSSVDLKERLADIGYAPKEGYWTGKFVGKSAGIYAVSHSLDKLHGTTRVIKSGKCYFLMSDKLDDVSAEVTGFQKPLGHPIELVPVSNPVTGIGPGKEVKIQVLYQKKPLEGARVTFIPRGIKLSEGFDSQYERTTKADGIDTYTPSESGYVLVSVHHVEPEQKGDGYDKTHYGATLTLLIPEICPICKK